MGVSPAARAHSRTHVHVMHRCPGTVGSVSGGGTWEGMGGCFTTSAFLLLHPTSAFLSCLVLSSAFLPLFVLTSTSLSICLVLDIYAIVWPHVSVSVITCPHTCIAGITRPPDEHQRPSFCLPIASDHPIIFTTDIQRLIRTVTLPRKARHDLSRLSCSKQSEEPS